MTQTLTAMRPRETVTFDPAVLARVCDRHGPDAERHIADVLTQVEDLVADAEAAGDDIDALVLAALEIGKLAGDIGMVTTQRAATGLLDALASGSSDARAACLARLVRLGQPNGMAGFRMDRMDRPDTVA